MAILKNRIKIKNNLLEVARFVIYLIRRFSTLILLASSFYLLYFSTPKLLSELLLETAGKALEASSLIYGGASNSFRWIKGRLLYCKDLEEDNLELKLQVAHLQQEIKIASDLKRENISLKKMLNVVKNVNRDFVTTKVIGVSNTPFSSTAILRSGRKNNVKINDIVKNQSGLIGRIGYVSDHYSTVILIDDSNSRIPVITSNSRINGILAKQGDNLKVIYLEEGNNVSVGETLYTSGDGKIFPKGIPIATIVKIGNNSAFVKEIEKCIKMEYVVVESNS